MKKLVLIGGGGHCKSVLDAALRSSEYTEIVITDPYIAEGASIYGCKVVGKDEVLPTLREKGFDFAFITVGSIEDASLRIILAQRAKELGFKFPVIADPSSILSEYACIGEGSFIGKNAVVNASAEIGRHCIVNTGCIVEHECQIGDFAHVSIGAILCGNVRVGKESFIGAGSTVIQGLIIGNNTVVGAGSVVIRNISDNVKAYGNVCRVVE